MRSKNGRQKHPGPAPVRYQDEKASNEESLQRSADFVKQVLQTHYVRGDRVDIKHLFLHLAKAPPELQKHCSKDMKAFMKMLSRFPDTFVVKNNYVCLNIFANDINQQTTVVDNLEAACKAVEEISKYKEFGLKVVGPVWGVSGKISLISVVLPAGQIFLFDVETCPTAVTGTSLANLLESEDMLKICHACQNDAGALYSNFNIQLRSVFDTQCAFKVIQYSNPQMLDDALSPQYLSLPNVMDYFELNGDDLFEKEDAVKQVVNKDAEVWTKRPLNPKLTHYAAASVAALPILYSDMKPDWALKFNKILYQNLVFEEVYRFLTPLIIKRRQNIRQTRLRTWKRKVALEQFLTNYTEKRLKDIIWKNDYSVKPKTQVAKMGDPRSATPHEPVPANAIRDVTTKFFLSHNKRFYFDIKEQNDTRFVKVSEVSSLDQSRNMISVNLNLVTKFRDVLNEIQNRPMPSFNRDSGTSMVHSVSIVKDTRRYLVDLKRNRRGYFIMISQMLPLGGKLSSITFNMQDLKTFIQIFHDIVVEFGLEAATVSEGNYMRSRNRRFFFNINQNERGVFMRISEIVSPNYQTSMTIAEQSWDEFLYNCSRTIEAFRKCRANHDASVSASDEPIDLTLANPPTLPTDQTTCTDSSGQIQPPFSDRTISSGQAEPPYSEHTIYSGQAEPPYSDRTVYSEQNQPPYSDPSISNQTIPTN